MGLVTFPWCFMYDNHFVIIHDFRPMLKRVDFESFFDESKIEPFFDIVLRFITEGVKDEAGIEGALCEVEDLIHDLHSEHFLSDRDVDSDERFSKLCGVVFSICRDLADVLLDVGYYRRCRTWSQCQPTLKRISLSNFTITAKNIRR